jgi:hypothetical protein
VDFRRRQTVPTTMVADPRGRGISRRSVLKTGLVASASLMAGPGRARAQDATPVTGLTEWGIFGRADGAPFDAEEFLRLHPQWNWQEGYLESRPSQP